MVERSDYPFCSPIELTFLIGPAGHPARRKLARVYPMRYNQPVWEVRQTATFSDWYDALRDRRAKVRIDIRIRRLSLGNPGDVKSLRDGISELRVDYGPGYRIYFARRGVGQIILLVGGDKSSQNQDILAASALAREL